MYVVTLAYLQLELLVNARELPGLRFLFMQQNEYLY